MIISGEETRIALSALSFLSLRLENHVEPHPYKRKTKGLYNSCHPKNTLDIVTWFSLERNQKIYCPKI